jgi:WD40 repeat protein
VEGQWQRVLDLANEVEHDAEVEECIARATDELDRPRRLVEELADAYAHDRWVQVIRLARQLGPDAPPQAADWVVRAWREVTVVPEVHTGHTSEVTALAVAPDNRRVISGSLDGTLRLWHLATGTTSDVFEISKRPEAPQMAVPVDRPVFPVLSLAMSPDGQTVVVGSVASISNSHEEGLFISWSFTQRRILSYRQGSSFGPILAVAVTPDRRHVLCGSRKGLLRLDNILFGFTSTDSKSLSGHTASVSAVCTPTNESAVSSSYDKTVRSWNLVDGSPLHTFPGHEREVLSLAVTPDGQYALSGSADKTLRLWNLSTGELVRTFSGHTDAVQSVTILQDGRLGLSGSDDKTIRLWDLNTGQTLRTFTGHTAGVLAVAVAATSEDLTIISAGRDRAVCFWRLR